MSGEELREMAGGDDGTNDQEHISGPLGQPHTHKALSCIFSRQVLLAHLGGSVVILVLQIMTMMATH